MKRIDDSDEEDFDLDFSGLNDLWDETDKEMSDFISSFPDNKEWANLLAENNYYVKDYFDNSNTKTNEKLNKKSLCRHFLNGHCARADCWFSHETDEFICKFFLKGSCIKGVECEFIHENVAEIINPTKKILIPANPKQQTQYPNPFSTVDAFPTLPKAQRPIYEPSTSSSSNIFESPPIQQLKIDDNNDDKTSAVRKGKKNRQKKKEFLDIWSTTPLYTPSKPAVEYSNAIKKVTISSPTQQQSSSSVLKPGKIQGKVKLENIDWLDTGTHVSALYKRFRSEAIEVAKQRNEIFNRARDAFLNNNKKSATSLSSQGRELNEKMHSLHRTAAKQIFHHRNSNLDSTKTSGTVLVDLHGLHPDEAVDCLFQRLEEMQSRKFKGRAIIVAGTGHHSGFAHTGGQSKSYTALLAAMEEQTSWSFREGTKKGDDFGGIIVVYFI